MERNFVFCMWLAFFVEETDMRLDGKIKAPGFRQNIVNLDL